MTAVLMASVMASGACARPEVKRTANVVVFVPSRTNAPARSPRVSRREPARADAVPAPRATTVTPRRPSPPASSALFGTPADAAIGAQIVDVFCPKHAKTCAAAAQALGVFDCESGDHDGRAPYTFGPTQISSSDDYGVAQLHKPSQQGRAEKLGFTWDQMLTVRPNLVVAKDLHDESGWGPWTCGWAA